MFNTKNNKSSGETEPTTAEKPTTTKELTPEEEMMAAMMEEPTASAEPTKAEETTADGDGEATPNAPISFADELEKRLADINKLNDKFLRKCADVENFKKRLEKEKSDAIVYANSNIVKDILTVTDNLERALDHCKDDDGGSLKGGVELTLKSMYETLLRHGVTEIQAKGKKFDPNLHEAVSHEVKEGVESDTVTTVFQKGFMLKDKLLRPALVIVAK